MCVLCTKVWNSAWLEQWMLFSCQSVPLNLTQSLFWLSTNPIAHGVDWYRGRNVVPKIIPMYCNYKIKVFWAFICNKKFLWTKFDNIISQKYLSSGLPINFCVWFYAMSEDITNNKVLIISFSRKVYWTFCIHTQTMIETLSTSSKV